jgi:hypothetical protein
LPRRRDVSPVQGHAGLRRSNEGTGVAIFHPSLVQHHACLPGEGSGLAPSVACYSCQRPLAE